ncbi:hypothetical protein HU200_062577 [Digitaria exilis]|uniref:Uncharacterized protein n=1 Tax=Digitaria exilis TaxID=1010633 RepID=A0A835DYE5_9POAL|nr:hypothetical protein HU200_062577 [Digitaria exilis]
MDDIGSCSDVVLDGIRKRVIKDVWQVNGLMLFSAIIMGIVVFISVCAPRYRHHPIIGFIFKGANTLFLPIIPIVAAYAVIDSSGTTQSIKIKNETVKATRYAALHNFLVVVWTGLVVFVGASTSVAVAGDSREGRNIEPSTDLLIKAILVSYLIISQLSRLSSDLYVHEGSFILGRNPRLIVPYMAQLDGSQEAEPVGPPRLIVQEGGPMTLEEEPLGYSYGFGTPPGAEQQKRCIWRFIRRFFPERSSIKRINTKKGSELVTLDKIWGSHGCDSFSSTPEAKDLCLSFALFKLLRCRFAKYKVYEAGFLQVFSIGFCLFVIAFVSQALNYYNLDEQITYFVYCYKKGEPNGISAVGFGYVYLVAVPVYFVLAAVLISEIKELLSHLCSNFTKVALICNYVHRTPCPKLVAFVSKHLRCKWLLDPWDDKMSQCKILVFHPWKVSVLIRRLFCMPNQKKVKVPSKVKKSIIKAVQRLESEHPGQALEHIRLPRSPISSSSTSTATGTQSACDGRADAQSACGGRGVADTILAWHIATSILDVKDPRPTDHPGCKTAAIRLSQYCAYLVCYRPELLPDDAEWCKTLQEAVREDAARATSGLHRRAAKLERVVELIEANSKHDVVREGRGSPRSWTSGARAGMRWPSSGRR